MLTENGRKRIVENAYRTAEITRKKHRDKYFANPKLCVVCGKIILYEKRCNKFCDRFCYYKCIPENNRKRRINKSTIKKCINCGAEAYNKFCSQKCCIAYKNNNTFYFLESLDDFSGVGIEKIRKYFKKKSNYTCSICGLAVWNGKNIPLVLDHIDGNSDNWLRTNLRVACPNCDALLPTYKSKNFGRGRAYRRKRYAEGKSY